MKTYELKVHGKFELADDVNGSQLRRAMADALEELIKQHGGKTIKGIVEFAEVGDGRVRKFWAGDLMGLENQ